MKTLDYSTMSNEKVLFIVNSETGVAPYSHEFIPGGADPQVLSGFVSAMASFMGEVTGSLQTRWKTVYGQDTLLGEGGEWTLGVIVVSKEPDEIRSKVRRVVMEIEDTIDSLRNSSGITGGVFADFNQYVRRVFLDDRLGECTEVMKGEDWLEHEII